MQNTNTQQLSPRNNSSIGSLGDRENESTNKEDNTPFGGHKRLSLKIPQSYTTLAIYGQEEDYNRLYGKDFTTLAKLAQLAEYLRPQDFKRKKWSPEVTPQEITVYVMDSLRKSGVNQYEDHHWILFGELETDEYDMDIDWNAITIVKGYRKGGDCFQPPCSFLPELEKKNPLLAEVILVILGKVSKGVSLWEVDDRTLEMIDQYREDAKCELKNTNSLPAKRKEQIQSHIAELEADEAYYTKGEPYQYLKKAYSLGRKTSVKKLKAKIEQCESMKITGLKPFFKSALEAIALPRSKGLGAYGCRKPDEDYFMHPHEYLMFRWEAAETSSNYIEVEIDEYMQMHYNEGGFSPFREALTFNLNDKNPFEITDNAPAIWEAFLFQSSRLFHSLLKP